VRVRKWLVLIVALVGAGSLASPSSPSAHVSVCGLPDGTEWIDVAGGDWWQQVFARRGLTLAVGSISATGGPDVPTEARAAGANTVYWDNYMNKRVGTPGKPADPATIVEKANKVFDYAVKVSGCATPIMGENELSGAKLPTPWSTTNAQYRANVLTFLQTLAARGAHPFLAVPTDPSTRGDARTWWQQVGQVAAIVPEVYFAAPKIYNAGPIRGNRILRTSFRKAIRRYMAVGVPAEHLGVFLGFQTTKGSGGREGLEPASSWFRVTKWQALAAKQVSRELNLGSVWSWGWQAWSTFPQEYDPDKPAAACVYLWARDPTLCDGPKAAGAGFNASVTEGQVILPRGAQCRFGKALISGKALTALSDALGDRDAAYSLLLQRTVITRQASPTSTQIAAAQRRLVASVFGNDQQAYAAELDREKLTPSLARGLLTDELRQQLIARRVRTLSPSNAQVRRYYRAHSGATARRVRVAPAASWLGRSSVGIAFEPYAPAQVFRLGVGRRGLASSLWATYRVRPLSAVKSLHSFLLADAAPAVRAALVSDLQQKAFQTSLGSAEKAALDGGTCRLDSFPKPGFVDLPKLFPFLTRASA
jgi:hypothetical protein